MEILLPFIFEITKGAILFIGGMTSFLLIAFGILVMRTPKDQWERKTEIPVINTRTNTWEIIKIPVIPLRFRSTKEIEAEIFHGNL